MDNKSGLKPLGFSVLLEPYEPEMKSKGGIVIVETKKQQMEMADQRAIVVEVGSECWADEKQPRAVPGDRVLVGKYAGYFAVGPADGKKYRMVLDRDIFCQIMQENPEVWISYV